MMVDGIIFDFDGTLFDSMYVWRHAADNYLLSLSKTPRDTISTEVAAMNIKQAAEYLRTNYGIYKSTPEIINDINKLAENEYKLRIQPKSGVVDALKEMHSQGIKMCVATTNVSYLVKAAAERCGIDKYFSAYFSGTELDIDKNTPHIYELALEHLDTEKNKTWIFEDSLYAVKSAKSGGFKVAAVYDEYSVTDQKELEQTADIYINSISDWKKIYD